MDIILREKKIKTETIYSHKKGGKYTIINIGEMKYNEQWFQAIIYKCLSSGKVYGRSEESFNSSFKVVEDE